MRLKMRTGSLSRLCTIHLRTSVNSLFFKEIISSLMFVSDRLTRTPASILPDTEYRCSSLSTLRQSGKNLLSSSATALGSNSTFSSVSMSPTLAKNLCASLGFCSDGMIKSTTEQRECNGGISLFL